MDNIAFIRNSYMYFAGNYLRENPDITAQEALEKLCDSNRYNDEYTRNIFPLVFEIERLKFIRDKLDKLE
jgi:hypothetical protein